MLSAPRGSATSPLVYGRDAESSRLDAALEAMTRGEPRPVVIGGEAGIGKTRLIDEALDVPDPACAYCTASAWRWARHPLPALRRRSSATSSGRCRPRAEPMVGPARAELARFLPELTAVVRADGQASPAPARTTNSNAFASTKPSCEWPSASPPTRPPSSSSRTCSGSTAPASSYWPSWRTASAEPPGCTDRLGATGGGRGQGCGADPARRAGTG